MHKPFLKHAQNPFGASTKSWHEHKHSNECASQRTEHGDQTTYQTIYFDHTNNITYEKQVLAKFEQSHANCQDHKQDCSSLSISTLLVHKPAVLHPILQSCIPEKCGIELFIP